MIIFKIIFKKKKKLRIKEEDDETIEYVVCSVPRLGIMVPKFFEIVIDSIVRSVSFFG